MQIGQFIKQIWQRCDWNVRPLTLLGLVLLAAIWPLMRYADPQWFIEDGAVENLQLLIIVAAFIVALTAPQHKKLFFFAALIVAMLFGREINFGRGIFCALYLSPDEVCKWNKFHYGHLVGIIQLLCAAVIVIYALVNKLWHPVWQYIKNAPIFVWDILIFAVATIGGAAAELPCIDNEIMEESMESIMYVALAVLLWRYGHCVQIKEKADHV